MSVPSLFSDFSTCRSVGLTIWQARGGYLGMPPKRKPPIAPLRRIAVYVDEPEPGWFAWVLSEASEDLSTWSQIETTDEWLGSYKEAMAAGLVALQAMVGDLDHGPREEPPAEAKQSVGNRTGFGFGFGAKLP